MNRKYGTMMAWGLTAGLILALNAVPAVAQSKKGAPASFSNKPTTAASSAQSDAVVNEEDMADAIMGDALAGIFDEADEHYHHGEWNHCLSLYRVVEQGDPHNVETYSNAAMLLWSTDRNDQAIEQLKLGIAANPNTSFMYDELGSHYWLHLKDPVSAIPYYEKAIQYKCNWPTYHNLAFCYQKLGKWDKAVAVWRQATKFGDDPRAQALLKQAQAHLASQPGSH